MVEKEEFDMVVILTNIKKDIQKQKYIVLWTGFVSFIISFILIPLSVMFFFLMFLRFDHNLIYIYCNTNYFLIPYDIMLIYYFSVMYFKDKTQHIKNKKHYQKAILFSIVSFIVSVIAIYFGKSTFMMILYFIFFITVIYYLSYTYYDIALKDAFDNLKNPLYRDDDLGWNTPMGVLDNPFSYKDDLNRAKLFVQTFTVGFDFVIVFLNQAIGSILFWYAIGYRKHIQESVRMFDLILENRLKGGNEDFSYLAFNILKTLNYISIRNDNIRLPKRGSQVAKKASKKDTFFTDTLG
ncbi:MAG: hypothetical protein ABGW74_00155 [Campylobacterales bacterium]